MAVLPLFVAGAFIAACATTARPSERTSTTLKMLLWVVAWMGTFALLAQAGLLARLDLRPPPLVFAGGGRGRSRSRIRARGHAPFPASARVARGGAELSLAARARDARCRGRRR